jgi:hypothetical protein
LALTAKTDNCFSRCALWQAALCVVILLAAVLMHLQVTAGFRAAFHERRFQAVVIGLHRSNLQNP